MESQKHLFSLDPDVRYLNCAYKSPLLRSAEEASIQALVRERNPYLLSVDDFFVEVQQVRERFGRIINCQPDHVAVVPSTSYGFASVLNGYEGKPNGEVVTIGNEFPSGYFAAQRWCKTNDNKLVVIEPDADQTPIGPRWNTKLIESISDDTSIVLLSSVHWMTGLKFDLEAIGQRCAEVDAKFVVDGTQSVGAAPIDVQACRIDALIVASYKWLFGPYSLGLAYVGDALLDGAPVEESWMNRANAKEFSKLTDYEARYRRGAGKFNVGETSNFVLMPILQAGLKQIEEWSVPGIQAYCNTLVQPLLGYMRRQGMVMEEETFSSPHLLSLNLPQGVSADQLKQKLAAKKVIVSTRGEHLRISVNVFNEAQDLDALMRVLEEV